MAQPISTQHPAVALRSHFNAVRAMLVVALIAVIALTVAVVILATDDQQQVTGATRAAQAQPQSGPSESRIAEAIGSSAGSPSAAGPDESTVARSVSGR